MRTAWLPKSTKTYILLNWLRHLFPMMRNRFFICPIPVKIKKAGFRVGFVALVAGFLLGTPLTFADTQPLTVELTLQYNPQQKHLEVLKQRLLEIPAPKQRDARPIAGELVFQCENGEGIPIGSFPVVDPTVMHAEWLAKDELEGHDHGHEHSHQLERLQAHLRSGVVTHKEVDEGLVTGDRFQMPDGIFMVRVPYSEHLASVRVLKPKVSLQTEDERTHAMMRSMAPATRDADYETMGTAVLELN